MNLFISMGFLISLNTLALSQIGILCGSLVLWLYAMVLPRAGTANKIPMWPKTRNQRS